MWAKKDEKDEKIGFFDKKRQKKFDISN